MRHQTTLAVIGVVAVSVASSARQVPAPTPEAVAFEVASVKVNRSGDTGSRFRREPGGRLVITNQPLRSLIMFAYELQGYQLVNAPSWTADERYDIIAKLAVDPPVTPPGSGPGPFNHAVRLLLEDRFKMNARRDTRQLDIYALVMARPDGKPGPALTQTTQDCAPLMEALRRGGRPPAPQPGGPEVMCGMRMTSGRVVAGGFPIGPLATSLANQLGRYVVDRTGLTGGWDFTLTFLPDRAPAQTSDAPAIDPNAPSLFTALQEQLGLKLESTKGPVDVVVVDSIERAVED
jgi:uncharacterized protein (TIGR03435 family)